MPTREEYRTTILALCRALVGACHYVKNEEQVKSMREDAESGLLLIGKKLADVEQFRA